MPIKRARIAKAEPFAILLTFYNYVKNNLLLDIGLKIIIPIPNINFLFLYFLLSLYNTRNGFNLLNSKLYPLVFEPNVKIYASESSHFSIGTSPYYAHQHAVGIDIYDQLTLENYEVVSPVSGTVLQIKEMRAPQPKFKEGCDTEYLTVIQNSDDKGTVFKILHVKPALKVDQEIKPGDLLGTTIRNGYFAPWSSPHIHLELKKPEDVLRAKKGLHFLLNTEFDVIMNSNEPINYEKIPLKVEYICDEFILCRFPADLYFHIKPFFGIRGTSGSERFIIDGGIPQYKHGIVHFCDSGDPLQVQYIYFNNVKVGTLKASQERYGLVQFNKVKMRLNKIPIRGISLFLAKFRPFIKLIPLVKDDFDVQQNSTQNLSLNL